MSFVIFLEVKQAVETLKNTNDPNIWRELIYLIPQLYDHRWQLTLVYTLEVNVGPHFVFRLSRSQVTSVGQKKKKIVFPFFVPRKVEAVMLPRIHRDGWARAQIRKGFNVTHPKTKKYYHPLPYLWCGTMIVLKGIWCDHGGETKYWDWNIFS